MKTLLSIAALSLLSLGVIAAPPEQPRSTQGHGGTKPSTRILDLRSFALMMGTRVREATEKLRSAQSKGDTAAVDRLTHEISTLEDIKRHMLAGSEATQKIYGPGSDYASGTLCETQNSYLNYALDAYTGYKPTTGNYETSGFLSVVGRFDQGLSPPTVGVEVWSVVAVDEQNIEVDSYYNSYVAYSVDVFEETYAGDTFATQLADQNEQLCQVRSYARVSVIGNACGSGYAQFVVVDSDWSFLC